MLSVENSCGKIAFPGVWQERNDGLSGIFRPLGQLHGRPEGGAGGDPGEDTLLPGECAGLGKRGLAGDGEDLIYYAQVKDVGDEVGTDALQGMRPSMALCQQDSAPSDSGQRR